jgi:hypothetical protein
MKDLQLMELQSSAKDSVGNNLHILETIHLRYLEEIKNLNINLQAFRSEKENEVRNLSEQLKQTKAKLSQKEQDANLATKKLDQ